MTGSDVYRRIQNHCRLSCVILVLYCVVVANVWWIWSAASDHRVERAWTVIAAWGLVFTAWMAWNAWGDYRAVERAIRGGYAQSRGVRWWIAVGALVGNQLTLFVWAGFILVGVMSMFRLGIEYAGWVLIAMEAVFAVRQGWERFVRVRALGRPHAPRASGGTR